MSQLPMCDPSPSTERARAKVESSSCVHFSWASLISPPWYPMALAGSVPAKYGLYDRCTNRSSILRCSATAPRRSVRDQSRGLGGRQGGRDVELDRMAEAAQHMYLQRCLRK